MKTFWIAIAAGAVGLGGATASFAQSAGDNASVSSETAKRSAPWTDESMARAKSTPLPGLDPSSVQAAIRLRGGPTAAAAGSTDAAVEGGNGERASDLYKKPAYWSGLLFYHQPDGDYSCSGQFIAPKVLLTAAHCVRDSDTGAWYDGFIFALEYRNGKYASAYEYDCVATKQGWVQPGFEKYQYDYAMILTQKASSTGYFGTQWNWAGAYKEATRIGYAAGQSKGEAIHLTRGSVKLMDGIVAVKHGDKSDQAGISGAAWIGDYTEKELNDKGNYVISVDSFDYAEEPGVNYGPYFTDAFKDLLDYVENGCK